MSTQFKEPFFPEQAQDILEQLVVFTGHGPVSHADRERVDEAITKIIEAQAAASQADQVALLEWVLQSNGGGDWRRRVEVKLATLRKGEK